MADAPAQPKQKQPKQTGALISHYLFKTAAVVWFILGTFFISGFVLNFVVALVLIALDFWTVKNVTGRLLVGLRWWNEANESGSAWRFEQAPADRQYSSYEKRLFWIGLVANVVAWALLAVLEVFRLKFDYLIIPIIAMIMGSSNFYGYFKCSREAQAQVTSYGNNLMTSAATSYLSNAMKSSTASSSAVGGAAKV